MTDIIYVIPGMTCGGCVRTITNAVKATDPQAIVTPDLASHKVRITSKRQPENITAAIREAGYELQAA